MYTHNIENVYSMKNLDFFVTFEIIPKSTKNLNALL